MKSIINKISWSIKEKMLSTKKNEIQREKSFPELDKIKSCLVIWKAHADELKWEESLKRELPQKRIDKVCVISSDFQGNKRDDIIYINNDDIDMKGNVNNPRLNELLAMKYDLLIDLNGAPEVLADFVVRNSHALCKVSMVKESDVIDIMIDGATSESELISQTVAVLSKLKKC